MTVLFRPFNGNSQTEGATPTFGTGGANAGSGSQFEARAAQAFSETYGILLPVMSTSFRRLEYTFSDGNQASGQRVWSFAIKPIAFSSVNTFFASFTNGAGTGQADVRFNTSGTSRTVTIRNIANANAVSTGTATYSTGTQYRFEFSVTIGGNIELRTYLWGDTTLIESITLAATSITQIGKCYLGVTAAAASWTAAYGDIMYADNWTGNWTSGSITPLFTYNLGPTPWFAAHRGAYGPEEVLQAYQTALVRSPTSGLECDLNELSDGWALLHDSTVDRTADVTSPITTGAASGLTKAQFRTVLMTDLSSYGLGVRPGITLDDWATAFGPSSGINCWLMPEVKTGSDATQAASDIIAAGIAPRCIVQAFSFTNASILAAAGLETLFLMASGDSHTFAQVKAAGINHIGRSTALWTGSDITAAKAAGLKAWAFTVDTTVDRDTWLATGSGIDGFFSNQPALLNPPPVAVSNFSQFT